MSPAHLTKSDKLGFRKNSELNWLKAGFGQKRIWYSKLNLGATSLLALNAFVADANCIEAKGAK